MCKDINFIEQVQSLLDAGNTPNKVAAILNVHHSKVNRVLNRGLAEVYTAFDELEDTMHLYQNFEWLWEEDVLEKIFSDVLDGNVTLPDAGSRDEDWLRVSKYVRETYKDIFNYAKEKNKEIALDFILVNCSTCGVLLSLENFFRKRNGGFLGLDGRCKTCCAKTSLRWYYANPDKAKEIAKIWASKNVDKIKAYTKIAFQKRAARKRCLTHDLTKNDMSIIMHEFKHGCALTGTENDIHLDHVIPLSIGHGGTYLGNIIPLRADLNLSKNANNIFEWFEANRQRFELSQDRFDNLIAWLASANAMTVEEYRDYVYWCHDNPRNIDELEAH